MASASASMMTSVGKSYIYDVFISFRGKDLRASFVDHLCEAFRKSGVIVFKDDKDIEVGKRISDELPKAIKDSKFHIVIFSHRYADSYWCLNELIEILEICRNPKEERTLYPIFYHVKPSEVREQKGAVGEAFSVHSENEAAGRWRAAMAEAASLEGWELTNTGDGHEVQFMKKIVHAISQKSYFSNFSVNENLVGMTNRVGKLLLSLQVGFDDFRMIGITGLGGVGKTTLAGVVFDRIANQFDGKSFVQNVRERSEDPRGLQDMQKQILTSVFGDKSIDVPSDFEGRSMMKRRMPNIKVLVVLDDVNDAKQLEALVEPSWFRPGSRIIITSRDRQVLVAHGVRSVNIHDVSTLSDEDAIRLLSRYAFNTESPAHGYEELSKKVVIYAAGLPLTIKTLSSSLRDCPVQEWEDAITRLETIPWGDTLKILKISYDALEEDQKEIFLHVACLLKGLTKKRAIRILESLGFRAKFGLGVLEQKSLITLRRGYDYYDLYDAKFGLGVLEQKYLITPRHGYDYYDLYDDKVNMHDHIEEMGMHIVRSLHPDEPRQHKLLWRNDEIEDIIEKDMGTKAIRGIKLVETELPPTKILRSLRKMSRLCFLLVERPRYNKTYRSYSRRVYEYHLPNSLQFLHWHRYPYRYLPKTFQGDKLVKMEMPESHIHQLWKGGERKVLPKLRFLNLSGSELKTFDFVGMTPNLEELVLRGCEKLVEVKISAECSHLKKLDLNNCKALEKLIISNECQNLDEQKLHGCKSFRELQLDMECPSRLKLLYLSDIKLRSLNLGPTPNLEVLSVECPMLTKLSLICISKLGSLNLGLTPNLEVLSVEYCKDLEEFVMLVECRMFTKLSLTRIHKLRSLNLGLTPNLEVLSVEYCKDLEELVMPVECRMLNKLSLTGIHKLRSLNLGLTPNLEVLSVENCEDLKELVMPVECRMLTKLSLGSTKLRSFSLGLTPNLEVLSVGDCEDLEELFVPVECPMLTKLSLTRIHKLRSLNLGMAHNLEVLSVEWCEDLEELPMPVECPMLTKLSLTRIHKLRSLNLGMAPHLELLSVEWCEDLEELVMPVECPMLTKLSLASTKLRSFSLGSTPNLEVLSVMYCEDLEELCMPVECPILAKLSLTRIHKLRSLNLGLTSNLEVLLVEYCNDLEELVMPVECPMLTKLSLTGIHKLRSLNLGLTPKEEHYVSFSDLLEKLKSLEELHLVSRRVKRLPDDSVYMLKHHLRVLNLGYCTHLEQLTEHLDRLECLEELILVHCKSLRSIPDCICNMTLLKRLNLSWCFKLEKLPDEFRRLQSLQVLHVKGIAHRLKNLPESISQLKNLEVVKTDYLSGKPSKY